MAAQKLSQAENTSSYMEDSDWAIANAQFLAENYSDQWIAIHEKKVIAHNKSLGEVVGHVRKFGIKEPVLTFIERGFRVYGYSTSISIVSSS